MTDTDCMILTWPLTQTMQCYGHSFSDKFGNYKAFSDKITRKRNKKQGKRKETNRRIKQIDQSLVDSEGSLRHVRDT